MKRPACGAIRIAVLVLAAWIGAEMGLAQTSEEQTAPEPAPSMPASSSFPWPNQFNEGGQDFTVYPPQLERWQADRLEGQAAVGVQPAGAEKPVFGTLWLSARTELDPATGLVTVHDIKAGRASFPTAVAEAAGYLEAIQKHLSTLTWTVARERLESNLAVEHAAKLVQSEPLRNAPPQILYSDAPAVLVPIQGAPQLKEMAGLGLQRVINTRALILQDKARGVYYLFVAGHWMEAPAIEGPWTEAYVRPSAVDEAKDQALANGQVDLMEGTEQASARVPNVFVATVPAELVQTDGPAQYAPIPRTSLLYVTNSPNQLFLDLQTQQYYVLLSGRWYRTASLRQGPWNYVSGASLPREFALIPGDHPTESVRASVPGTPQAQEAVIANSVPQVATIKRSAASLEMTYDGPPQFQPIEGTALQYIVNAPAPVIAVDSNSFYALDNGVWFASQSPLGPWTVATSVPPEIYTIPPSSPLHYVTYVRVYEATPDVVYEGYTPGYVGSYVAPDNTVVYGTGWYYQPWIGTVWYSPPVTWGFGFGAYYSWWSPWPWRPWWWWSGWRPWWWAGWGPGPCYRPWWGPWGVPARFAHRVPPAPRGKPAPVATGPSSRAHSNIASVTNIFQRWGDKVAKPLAAPPRPVSVAGNTRPPGAPSQRAITGRLPQVSAQAPKAMHGFGSAPGHELPAHGSGAGPGTPAPVAKPIPQNAVAANTSMQIFRRSNGQWEQFLGNGKWQKVNAPNLNTFNALPRSTPLPAQKSWSARPAMPAPRVGMAPQTMPWSIPAAPRIAVPPPPGYLGSSQLRPPVASTAPRGWSGGATSQMGRSSGAWAPGHAGATAAGRAPAGGQGGGWGGGGHMGGGFGR
ncbi:MAG TPA: hypothetical protein VMH32_02470 [Burkholderiales bacterium]|nr:hypothetical protein [Burkholderiales bacterium]